MRHIGGTSGEAQPDATRAVLSDGSTTVSPQTSARAAFQDHTASVLNAEITRRRRAVPRLHEPVSWPFGGHVRPSSWRDRPTARRCRSF